MSTKRLKGLLYSAFIVLTVSIVYPAYADIPLDCQPNRAYNAFADVTGDRRADAIVVNSSGITVRRSNWPDAFGPNESWTTNAYYGNIGTYFADVTGDGRADAIVVNSSGITVRRSTGSGFGGNESWSTAYSGNIGTYFADVTGPDADGKSRADAIKVDSSGITVRRSTGVGFGGDESWSTNAYYGNIGTYFVDVTGEGIADAVVVNGWGMVVRRSNGSGFLQPEPAFATNPYYGELGIYFADVTGPDKDGKSRTDAIVVNGGGVVVRRSNGSMFEPNQIWSLTPNYSDVYIYFADVTGDKRADKIQVSRANGVALSRSNGAGLLNPENILPPYYSDLFPSCIN